MAAITTALVSLAPFLIEPVLKSVERLFGPKTGDTKMEVAIAAITPVLEKLAAAGKLPGIPTEEVIRSVIEAIFQTNKSSIENPPFPIPANKYLCLPPGSKVIVELPKE